VEFVVVGGVAAVAHGAPISTFDLDVVYSLAPENLSRLQGALSDLDAVFRGDPRRIAPGETHLASRGHKLLQTRLGPLDLLGAISQTVGYDSLVTDAVDLEVEGNRYQVISLERLIEAKRAAGRPKDLLALPILEATLEERRRR
jgi:hypothetical protein